MALDCNGLRQIRGGRLMRYHLKNKATHWTGDGDMHFVWCITDNNGKKLTPWMSKHSANVELGKLLAKDRSKRGDNA